MAELGRVNDLLFLLLQPQQQPPTSLLSGFSNDRKFLWWLARLSCIAMMICQCPTIDPFSMCSALPQVKKTRHRVSDIEKDTR